MSDRVTVLFGGPSPEHEISILTGLQCERVLTDAGVEVQSIYWERTGQFSQVPTGLEAIAFASGRPDGASELTLEIGPDGGFVKRSRMRSQRLAVDVVLNCCHGGPGEAGVITGALELCGIPSTGGSAAASWLGMDKLAFGALVEHLDIPTLPRVALTSSTAEVPFEGPYIVKPRFGGSSLGISVVDDLETARALAHSSPALRVGAVIEPYLAEFDDINAAFRTRPEFAVSFLEKPIRGSSGHYAYADKYLRGEGLNSAPREVPAKVSDEVEAQVGDWARRLVEAAGFEGIGRIDFLLTPTGFFLNEINTIPGAMSLYLWPEDQSYADLLRGMVQEARQRPGLSTAHAIEQPGEALRVAGGISQKLSVGRPAR